MEDLISRQPHALVLIHNTCITVGQNLKKMQFFLEATPVSKCFPQNLKRRLFEIFSNGVSASERKKSKNIDTLIYY